MPRRSDRKTLVMVVHPQCPCTAASAAELERLLAACDEGVSAHVVAVVPAGGDEKIAEGRLVERLQAIPGVRVTTDLGGREAACFGAETSGHVMLYDADGRLLFSGGITPGRGHEGSNAGRDAIVELVRGGAADRASTPVFGCAVRTPERAVP